MDVDETQSSYIADADGNYTFHKPATAEEILALASSVLESRMTNGEPLSSPSETKQFLSCRLGGRDREVFGAIFLDNRHRVISFEELFYGTIDGASVHPREVVKTALRHNAAAIIFGHNHPSGEPEPSQADLALTKRLQDALSLVDVRVLDHIVIGGTETVSFAERGLL